MDSVFACLRRIVALVSIPKMSVADAIKVLQGIQWSQGANIKAWDGQPGTLKKFLEDLFDDRDLSSEYFKQVELEDTHLHVTHPEKLPRGIPVAEKWASLVDKAQHAQIIGAIRALAKDTRFKPVLDQLSLLSKEDTQRQAGLFSRSEPSIFAKVEEFLDYFPRFELSAKSEWAGYNDGWAKEARTKAEEAVAAIKSAVGPKAGKVLFISTNVPPALKRLDYQVGVRENREQKSYESQYQLLQSKENPKALLLKWHVVTPTWLRNQTQHSVAKTESLYYIVPEAELDRLQKKAP